MLVLVVVLSDGGYDLIANKLHEPTRALTQHMGCPYTQCVYGWRPVAMGKMSEENISL
jgi:hypothetical protein